MDVIAMFNVMRNSLKKGLERIGENGVNENCPAAETRYSYVYD